MQIMATNNRPSIIINFDCNILSDAKWMVNLNLKAQQSAPPLPKQTELNGIDHNQMRFDPEKKNRNYCHFHCQAKCMFAILARPCLEHKNKRNSSPWAYIQMERQWWWWSIRLAWPEHEPNQRMSSIVRFLWISVDCFLVERILWAQRKKKWYKKSSTFGQP